ncbi:hypothetical protein FQN53_000729 [Emmonsiellopsis sp. PD_33]|nr:hypothetical protein FQN53_000729 [Emmonsiellopsis sp. PD_33]
MASFLKELEKNPKLAARTVIISSYSTWSQRTLQVVESNEPTANKVRKLRTTAGQREGITAIA